MRFQVINQDGNNVQHGEATSFTFDGEVLTVHVGKTQEINPFVRWIGTKLTHSSDDHEIVYTVIAAKPTKFLLQWNKPNGLVGSEWVGNNLMQYHTIKEY